MVKKRAKPGKVSPVQIKLLVAIDLPERDALLALSYKLQASPTILRNLEISESGLQLVANGLPLTSPPTYHY